LLWVWDEQHFFYFKLKNPRVGFTKPKPKPN
jgi:hypothetical protein